MLDNEGGLLDNESWCSLQKCTVKRPYETYGHEALNEVLHLSNVY